METKDILKKVRKIEIKTRGLSRQIFSGQYHSAFKGKGMTFSEVREYQYGDDIRNIDWNVTARFNSPFVKVFEEEREMTVMLLIDVSGSNEFGTRQQLKEDMITEIAAVLSFSAIQNNDKVGVIFFSDRVEKFIPPKKGTTHILRIIRELIDFRPQSQQTDVAEALRFFTNVVKKRATTFILSDFLDTGFEDALKIAGRKHELCAIRIFDIRETEVPPVGLVKFFDKERSRPVWADTSSEATRQAIAAWWKEKDKSLKTLFAKSGIDDVVIRTDQDYVPPLVKMFKRRESRV